MATFRNYAEVKDYLYGLKHHGAKYGIDRMRLLARVMGHPENERIICSHEELFVRFWDRELKTVAHIAHLLPQVRRLIDEGKEREAYVLANTEARKQLIEKGLACHSIR